MLFLLTFILIRGIFLNLLIIFLSFFILVIGKVIEVKYLDFNFCFIIFFE